jgi:transcriptional regulator with XRE-family HTH domain
MNRTREVNVGDLVRAAREKADMTQAELSLKAGLSEGAVSQWEKPHAPQRPSLKSLEQVCKAMGITVRQLFVGHSVEEVPTTEMEREVLSLFRQLSREEQRAYLTILRSSPR